MLMPCKERSLTDDRRLRSMFAGQLYEAGVDTPAAMQRVMVIGSPGAGKSRLATELARRTGLPLIHLDQLS